MTEPIWRNQVFLFHKAAAIAMFLIIISLVGCGNSESALDSIYTDRTTDGGTDHSPELFFINDGMVWRARCFDGNKINRNDCVPIRQVPVGDFADQYFPGVFQGSLSLRSHSTFETAQLEAAKGLQNFVPASVKPLLQNSIQLHSHRLDQLKNTYDGQWARYKTLFQLLDLMEKKGVSDLRSSQPLAKDLEIYANRVKAAFSQAEAQAGSRCQGSATRRFVSNQGGCQDRASGIVWSQTAGGGLSELDFEIWANKASARAYCGNLKEGGYNDWRLPTMAEFKAVFPEGMRALDIRLGSSYMLQDDVDFETEVREFRRLPDLKERRYQRYNIIGNYYASEWAVEILNHTKRHLEGRFAFEIDTDMVFNTATSEVSGRLQTKITLDEAFYKSHIERSVLEGISTINGMGYTAQKAREEYGHIEHIPFLNVFPDPRPKEFNHFPGQLNNQVAVICVRKD